MERVQNIYDFIHEIHRLEQLFNNFSYKNSLTMDHCKDFIRAEFPSIDIEMFQYIEGKIIRLIQ